ncbi:leucyl aminopeptidase [Candidatus Kinetoplastibacterium desouzaii TCC079E]|uniref:Probable cytosol aminopeptidase n=1 Tax=Candidatus Kinetoplastidibacterium desouzai TCC079E TaxID=1208919 RepID=M1M440_9PROT|nr:leucyl aminopeptidase [Candidatus Kinetoplastibacterium desouzaii]AGF47000.1 leucyl aminopeptidase [Candidatus Kinetoplastibacterium desouzaii TCC079E]
MNIKIIYDKFILILKLLRNHYGIFYRKKEVNLSTINVDVIGLGVYSNGILSPSTEKINNISGNFLKNVLNEFKAKTGDSIVLYNVPNIKAKKIILIGLGETNDQTIETHIKAEESFISSCIKLQAKECISTLTENNIKNIDNLLLIKNAIIAANNSLYKYTLTLKDHKEISNIKKIIFTTQIQNENSIQRTLLEATAISSGINLAKELGNLPSNICTPTYLANEAIKLEKEFKNIKVNVLNIEEVQKLGMRSFISVSKGSDEPLKFIEIAHTYNGVQTEPEQKTIVIIGKGITFDSGGISLKPSSSMEEMKYDMCGAAATLGIMKSIAKLNLKQKIIALIPACENMPSGKANKPGDVIESMSGKTIEILNTDAEGRLILCDALTYAEKEDPYLVIDLATLTGACVVALGDYRTALFSNDEKISNLFNMASEKILDYVWKMPLDDHYKKQLKSNFADIANTGGSSAGSITAACFLSEFIGKYKWVHLDIAGTAWNKGIIKGATGRPVALVSQFLIDQENES